MADILTTDSLVTEVMLRNPSITDEQLLEIRNAPSLFAAVQLVEDSNLDMTGSVIYTGIYESVHGDIRQSERDMADRFELMEVKEFDEEVVVENAKDVEISRLEAQIAEIERLAALEDETFSPLLFADWMRAGGAPDERAFLEMIANDYEPWTISRREVARLTVTAMKTAPMTGSDAAYWRNQYMTPGAYVSGQELLEYSSLSAATRERLEGKMVAAGLPGMSEEDGVLSYRPGTMGTPQLTAMRIMMAEGTSTGLGYEPALDKMVEDRRAFDRWEAAAEANRPRSGARAPSFSIPSTLRQIPDYESVSQEVQNLFRQRLGRDAEDWEIQVLAEDMQDQYRNRNAEMIKAARAAFWQAQGGASGTMEVEVPDPVLRQQAFIEERYGMEIDRLEQTGDTSVTNRMMVDAITKGSRMVGGGV